MEANQRARGSLLQVKEKRSKAEQKLPSSCYNRKKELRNKMAERKQDMVEAEADLREAGLKASEVIKGATKELTRSNHVSAGFANQVKDETFAEAKRYYKEKQRLHNEALLGDSGHETLLDLYEAFHDEIKVRAKQPDLHATYTELKDLVFTGDGSVRLKTESEFRRDRQTPFRDPSPETTGDPSLEGWNHFSGNITACRPCSGCRKCFGPERYHCDGSSISKDAISVVLNISVRNLHVTDTEGLSVPAPLKIPSVQLALQHAVAESVVLVAAVHAEEVNVLCPGAESCQKDSNMQLEVLFEDEAARKKGQDELETKGLDTDAFKEELNHALVTGMNATMSHLSLTIEDMQPNGKTLPAQYPRASCKTMVSTPPGREGFVMIDPYLMNGYCLDFDQDQRLIISDTAGRNPDGNLKADNTKCFSSCSPQSTTDIHSRVSCSKLCTHTTSDSDLLSDGVAVQQITCNLAKLVWCSCDSGWLMEGHTTMVSPTRDSKCKAWSCRVAKMSHQQNSHCERLLMTM